MGKIPKFPTLVKCDKDECCCKCIYQYEIYPFSADHFHQTGGFVCIGISTEDPVRVCSHFKSGHGLCELFTKEKDGNND